MAAMDVVTYMQLNGNAFFATGEPELASVNPFEEPKNTPWYESENAVLQDNNMAGYGLGDYTLGGRS